MENNKENSEIELPKNPIFGHDGAQLLKKSIDRLELPEGFEDNNNNNFIPKRELSEMPIINPEKLMEGQTGWKPPKPK